MPRSACRGETLDALKEGRPVFGSDGRLKLFNPAFANMWALEPSELDTGRLSIASPALPRRSFPTKEGWGACVLPSQDCPINAWGSNAVSRAAMVRARLRRSTTPRWRDPTHLSSTRPQA